MSAEIERRRNLKRVRDHALSVASSLQEHVSANTLPDEDTLDDVVSDLERALKLTNEQFYFLEGR